MTLVVRTIGHSNQPFERFVDTLHAHGVARIADVRTVPRSRHVPWSSQENLAPALAAHEIAYEHLPGLGGLRKPLKDSPNAAWRNQSFRGYADYMQTPAFAAALDGLVALARDAPTAVMCAEAVPWRCHRGLVADALLARGHAVLHLHDATKAAPHKLTPFARVDGARVTYPDPQAKLPE